MGTKESVAKELGISKVYLRMIENGIYTWQRFNVPFI